MVVGRSVVVISDSPLTADRVWPGHIGERTSTIEGRPEACRAATTETVAALGRKAHSRDSSRVTCFNLRPSRRPAFS